MFCPNTEGRSFAAAVGLAVAVSISQRAGLLSASTCHHETWFSPLPRVGEGKKKYISKLCDALKHNSL